MTLPDRVVARFTESRRVIRLNMQGLRDLVFEMVQDAIEKVKRLGETATLDDWPRGRSLTWRYHETKDVKGRDQQIVVELKVRPGAAPGTIGGSFEPENKTVNLFLGGKLDVATFERDQLDLIGGLISNLFHEMTHAVDELGRMDDYVGVQDGKGSDDYYNQAVEVRAYGQQIVEQVVSAWRSLELKARRFKKPAPSLDGRFLEALLDKSSRWQEVEPHLNSKNRKIILQMVATGVQDVAKEMREK